MISNNFTNCFELYKKPPPPQPLPLRGPWLIVQSVRSFAKTTDQYSWVSAAVYDFQHSSTHSASHSVNFNSVRSFAETWPAPTPMMPPIPRIRGVRNWPTLPTEQRGPERTFSMSGFMNSFLHFISSTLSHFFLAFHECYHTLEWLVKWWRTFPFRKQANIFTSRPFGQAKLPIMASTVKNGIACLQKGHIQHSVELWAWGWIRRVTPANFVEVLFIDFFYP